jgi:hypothetical protein
VGSVEFADSGDQAGQSASNTNAAMVRLGSTLRLIGRAARIPVLSQLGRTVGILGRAFAVAAPALFVAALEKIASSAADAADKVADLAAQNNTSLASFQEFASAFSGLGLGCG